MKGYVEQMLVHFLSLCILSLHYVVIKYYNSIHCITYPIKRKIY